MYRSGTLDTIYLAMFNQVHSFKEVDVLKYILNNVHAD